MPEIEFKIDDLRPNFESIKTDLMPEAIMLIDDIAEIERSWMIALAPFLWGDLREGHTIEEIGILARYVYSDVPHFEPVVAGHTVLGPFSSEKQLHWWFWHLKNELGGKYEPKVGTGNKTAPNKYPSEALIASEGEVDARIEVFYNNSFGSFSS